jgi:hypothetical protein
VIQSPVPLDVKQPEAAKLTWLTGFGLVNGARTVWVPSKQLLKPIEPPPRLAISDRMLCCAS